MIVLSSHDLSRVGRQVRVPFVVKVLVADEVCELEVTKVFRQLPGKRLTALARFKGKTVVAKLFFHPKSWQRHHAKERNGIQEIRKQGFSAPDIVSEHQLQKSGSVILLEYLKTARSLAELLSIDSDVREQGTSSEESKTLRKLVIKLLCDCHNVGLWQRDMHLGNYLLKDGQLYLIDGADIQLREKAATKQERLINIADFVSQFPVRWDKELESMLTTYQEGYEKFSLVDIEQVRGLIQKIRLRRLAHIEKKAFKATSANQRIKNAHCYCVYDRKLKSEHAEGFIDNSDSPFEALPLLKDGDTTTVGETALSNFSTVVKRYNIVSFGKWVSHLFIPSRAHKCWKNANMLLLLGLKTLRPFMFYEERRFWIFRLRAYFLSEKLPSANLLEQLSDNVNPINREDLISEFEIFFNVMKDYQISHGDMKATNFIYYNRRVYILDLDAMKRHKFRWLAKRKAVSDIRRFEKNWRGGPYEELFAPLVEKLYLERQVSTND